MQFNTLVLIHSQLYRDAELGAFALIVNCRYLILFLFKLGKSHFVTRKQLHGYTVQPSSEKRRGQNQRNRVQGTKARYQRTCTFGNLSSDHSPEEGLRVWRSTW